MTQANVVLMSSLDLPVVAGEADVPDWIHLVPNGRIETHDGRGPYQIEDAQAVINASMADRGDIEIDENHASFLSAPKGGEAPARGWIVEMQARDDGIWGRVDWTDDGRRLVASRAYRRISPVFDPETRKTGRISKILNVSLVNRNNLRGLAALNQQQEPDMDLMAKLAELLGLEAGADEAAITAAIEALKTPKTDDAEMQAQISEIGAALGCEAGSDAGLVLNAALEAGKAKGDDGVIAELQAELATVTTSLNEIKETGAREKAEGFVDSAIREGRVGVKPMRDRYVSMHMADPGNTEALINAMPQLGSTPTTLRPTPSADGQPVLNAEQLKVARMLGQDPKVYAAALEAERAAEQETL